MTEVLARESASGWAQRREVKSRAWHYWVKGSTLCARQWKDPAAEPSHKAFKGIVCTGCAVALSRGWV